MKFFERIWKDLRNGENIDVYLTLAISIVVAIASVFGIAQNALTPLTLAVLALLSYAILGSRRKVNELIEKTLLSPTTTAESFLLTKKPNLEERLRTAKSIAINGITLSRTSDSYFSIFRNCFQQGGKVRLLIVNPNNPALEIASKRFFKHQDVNKVKREIEHALDNFETLFEQCKNKENYAIGLFSAMPPYGIWLIDAESPKAEIWVELYSFQEDEEPAFQLLPSRDGKWFDFFQKQFELMWQSSEKWKPQSKT